MKKKYIVILAILVFLAAAAIFAAVQYNSVKTNLDKLNEMVISDVDLSNAENGIYEGSYDTFPVGAKVKVTIRDHRITAIDLVEHKTGQGQGAEVLPAMVVEKQTLQLDTISGATYSSRVILKAIENALESAVK
ncbi:MAG TPA: FMN-binding protein [Clostridia bacterium]|nr:FMN-binding protein [Clostridia bacterium]